MISLKGLEFLNGKMDRIILDIGREGKWMAKGKYALRIIRWLRGSGLMGNTNKADL